MDVDLPINPGLNMASVGIQQVGIQQVSIFMLFILNIKKC